MRISRSELYAHAIADYLERSRSESVTEQLNKVYSQTGSELDPALNRVQLALMKQSPW